MELQAFVVSPERLWHVGWRPDGAELAVCGADKMVRVFARGADDRFSLATSLEDVQSRTIRSCEYSPSGKLLATASFDGTIALWTRDGGEWRVATTLEGHENEVKSVAWNASGALLATCGRDKTVWLWQVPDQSPIFDPDAEEPATQEWECISVLQGHSADVKMVKFHPNENLLLSCSYDDAIRVWVEDVDDWVCEAVLTGHSNTVWGVVFVDTNTFVSCSQDLSLRVWQREGASRWTSATAPAASHSRTVFSVDARGGLLASGGGDDALCVYSMDSGLPVLQTRVDKAHDQDVNCVRFCPAADGLLLASVGDDGVLKLWRV